jgi:hypothetical protein
MVRKQRAKRSTRTKKLPTVIVVDDNPTDLRIEQDEVDRLERIRLEVLAPDEVTAPKLLAASLVLVDYLLEDWPARENVSFMALKPATGLALVTILQEHAHAANDEKPRAFALHTGQVERLRHQLADADHVVARAHNLDWVFSKADEVENRWSRIADLAEAVAVLPTEWSLEDAEANGAGLRAWLAVPKRLPWSDRAWDDIVSCHPPAHELANLTHGAVIVRWMLQRILPHPTFLLDDFYLAARLRVTIESLRRALLLPAFRKWIGPATYTGALSNFLGSRWWRSGVESLVFSLVREDPANVELLHTRLRRLAPKLQPFAGSQPVVSLDTNYGPAMLCDVADAVRITPDHWPTFADAAWTSISSAQEEPRLAALVIAADRGRVGADI